MWPFKRNPAISSSLGGCLVEVIGKIESSEGSVWAGLSGEEVCMDLRSVLELINEEKKFDIHHLKMLFAPTGPIQEISIDNGWGEEFIALSAKFDELIEKS